MKRTHALAQQHQYQDARHLLRPHIRERLEKHMKFTSEDISMSEQDHVRRKALYVINRWVDSKLGLPRMKTPKPLYSQGQPEFEVQEAACVAMVEAVDGFQFVEADLLEFYGGKGLEDKDRFMAVMEFVAKLEVIISKQIYLYVNPDEPPFNHTLVTVEECAERMGKSVQHIARMCVAGKLEGAVKNEQGRWRIPWSTLVHATHREGQRKRKKKKKVDSGETTGTDLAS